MASANATRGRNFRRGPRQRSLALVVHISGLQLIHLSFEFRQRTHQDVFLPNRGRTYEHVAAAREAGVLTLANLCGRFKNLLPRRG
jgi:hypothetical protein